MPFYIASGKNEKSECSIKVFAHSDGEAFAIAKLKLPVVAGLERIEADGTVVPVGHLPFDSIHQVLITEQERRENRAKKVAENDRHLKLILFGGALLVGLCGLMYACGLMMSAAPRYRVVPSGATGQK